MIFCVSEVPDSPTPPFIAINATFLANVTLTTWPTATESTMVDYSTEAAIPDQNDSLTANSSLNTTDVNDPLAMKDESALSQRRIYIIGAGVLAAVIAALILGVIIHVCRRKSSGPKVDQRALEYLPRKRNPQNVYDYAGDVALNMNDNELYAAAGDVNDYDEVAVDKQESIYSKPNKRKKPEMTDNELYRAFDG